MSVVYKDWKVSMILKRDMGHSALNLLQSWVALTKKKCPNFKTYYMEYLISKEVINKIAIIII